MYLQRLIAVLALPVLLAALPASAETIGGNPGPQYNYVCPHADGAGALDCYFDAVAHLYTMCRNVKSIEIIEFGYEKSEEGTNGAKFDYCVDKQKLNITRPYQAALREASISKQAVESLRGLQEVWLASLVKLKWIPGESDADYKMRVVKPYDDFKDRIADIRKIVEVVRANVNPVSTANAATPAPAKKGKK